MGKNKEYTAEEFYDLINSESSFDSQTPFTPDKSVAKLREDVLKSFNNQVFLESEGQGSAISYKRASEKSLAYYIATGNLSRIQNIISKAGPINSRYSPAHYIDIGLLSDNPLQQATSMFVCGITIYTRAAIDGGLPEHIAYALSDNYIWHGLKLTDLTQLNSLQNCALYDFTNQVNQYKYRNHSIHIKKCCEYILRHMHEKITLQDLSKVVNKSTGYISKLFVDELGMRPTSFIRNQKLEYAAYALEMTDISVTALSDLLAFPSTSAFIGYFKENYKMTPLEYRNKKEFYKIKNPRD